MPSTHMARRSAKSPLPMVCEKNQSGCMCKCGLYSVFDSGQGHSNGKLLSDRGHLSTDGVELRGRLDLHTKYNEKCQGINDRTDNKTHAIDSGKASLRWLMQEEMPSVQQTNKNIITANVKHSQSNSKLGWKGKGDTDHQQLSHQNFMETSLSYLNHSASTKVSCRELHTKNRRSIFGCKSINCVDYDQMKKVNAKLAQVKDAEETKSQKFIHGKYIIRNRANHHPKQFLDALDILNSNKELFMELLQDPNSLIVKHIQDLQNSQAKGQHTMSSSGAKLSDYQINNARQFEEHACTNKLKCGDRFLPKGNGDPQASDTIVVLSPGPTTMQRSSGRIGPHFSQQHPTSFRTLGQSSRPTLFSFGRIKRKLKDALVVNKNEQHWVSSNGKSEKASHGYLASQGGSKGMGIQIVERNSPSNVLDIGGMPKPSLDVKRTDKTKTAKDLDRPEIPANSEVSCRNLNFALLGHPRPSKRTDTTKTAKDFELDRPDIAANSGVNCGNLNFALLGHPRQHGSDISAMCSKHLFEVIPSGNEDEDEDLLGKRVQDAWLRMLSFPERSLLPIVNPRREEEQRFATRQMKFSLCGNYQMVEKNRSKFQTEEENSCLSSLKKNTEALPSTDTQKPNHQLPVLETKPNISENHFAVMKVKEDGLNRMGEIKFGEHPPESHRAQQVGRNQSSDTAKKCEENEHLDSLISHSSLENQPSKFLSEVSSASTTDVHRVAGSGGLADQTEQPGPVAVFEQVFIEDSTSPESIICQPARKIISEDKHSAAQERSPWSPKNNSIATMDEHVSFSQYIREVLMASGLKWDEPSAKCHSSEQLLDQSLFNKLKMLPNKFCGDYLLLFEYINEVLAEVCQNSSGSFPSLSYIKPTVKPLTVEKNVICEVIERVDRHLLSQPQPQPQTFKQLAEQDLARSRTWLDVRNETEDIAIETVESIFEALLMEIIFEPL